VRFAARTGFTIAPNTLAAVRELRDQVGGVSAERIGMELLRMLSEGTAGPALRLLDQTGLLDALLPEVARMRGVPQPPEYHPEGDVFTHTLLMIEDLDATVKAAANTAPSDDRPVLDAIRTDPDAPETLAWAVLLHDVGKPGTITFEDRIRFDRHDSHGARIAHDVLGRLRRPARILDAVATLVDRHMKFCHIRDMREAKRRRLVQDHLFPLDLELHRLDCQGSHRLFDHYEFAKAAWLAEKARPPTPKPLLTGHDLIALGHAPGPRFGEILRAVDDLRLEGALQNHDAARAWVREYYPPPSPTAAEVLPVRSRHSDGGSSGQK
jgi:poly(A) polymerase